MEEQGKRISAATVEGEEEEEAGEVDGEKTAMKWTAVGDARMEWRGDMRTGKEKTEVGRRSRRRRTARRKAKGNFSEKTEILERGVCLVGFSGSSLCPLAFDFLYFFICFVLLWSI